MADCGTLRALSEGWGRVVNNLGTETYPDIYNEPLGNGWEACGSQAFKEISIQILVGPLRQLTIAATKQRSQQPQSTKSKDFTELFQKSHWAIAMAAIMTTNSGVVAESIQFSTTNFEINKKVWHHSVGRSVNRKHPWGGPEIGLTGQRH